MWQEIPRSWAGFLFCRCQNRTAWTMVEGRNTANQVNRELSPECHPSIIFSPWLQKNSATGNGCQVLFCLIFLQGWRVLSIPDWQVLTGRASWFSAVQESNWSGRGGIWVRDERNRMRSQQLNVPLSWVRRLLDCKHLWFCLKQRDGWCRSCRSIKEEQPLLKSQHNFANKAS